MHKGRFFANAGLLFASGFTGLIYEVLWMKQLGLLFGNTSHAAATTLSAFFLGLAVGGLFWGRRAAGMSRPLRGYALLEAGIAATALLYFPFLELYHVVYPLVFEPAGISLAAVAVKFGLSLLLVFPPALLMGGTVPLMGQHLIRGRRRFGPAASVLYGVNTLGAALGAYAAGFHLPLWLGYRGTCAAAVCVTVLIAVAAWLLARREAAVPPETSELAPVAPRRPLFAMNARAVAWLGFLSGFGVLGFEVLWTRMFAGVLQNSVYTFAAVLVTVLVCLALGAGMAHLLARLAWRPERVLFVLMVAAGLTATTTPMVFMHLTDDMRMVGGSAGWGGYILDVFRTTFLTLGVPGCLLGTVFPYLLKVAEPRVQSAGRTLGELSALNMTGAILGSLVAGFVLLDWLGLWTAVMVFSLLYPAAAVVLPVRTRHLGLGWRAAAVAVLLLCFFKLNPSYLPRVLVNQHDDGEELVEVFEGSGAVVAVTRHVNPGMSPAGYPLSIRLNNHYGLGSTVAMTQQQMQADIPLMVRSETQSVFFLGMGTGITPGTALEPYYSVDRVVTCELVPEVVTAARKYFEPYVNGLFTDARSTVVVDDGRHHLSCTSEAFDLIDADLFVPCRSGAGSLYTVEHFRTARERLKPGGMFVQWLPLYQLTREEFGIIARSMLEAFPQVTLWRGNFRPGKEVVGLVGHRDTEPLPAVESKWANRKNMLVMALSVMDRSVLDLEHLVLPLTPRTVLVFYCGNLSAIRDRFDPYPVNTDDRPWIEYLAPRSHQREAAGQASWFVAGELIGLLETLQQACPPETDPMLANRTPSERRLPRAGLSFHQARVHAFGDSWEAADRAWQAFFPDWLAREE